jgi:hypothetical protein
MSNTEGYNIQVASKISGVKENSLHINTRITSDLRLDGDDAWELVNEVNSRYSLNFEGFNFDKYFTDESKINSIREIIEGIFSKKIKESF